MCGICGVVAPSTDALDHEALLRMREALAHRGPDGAGEMTSVANAAGGGVPLSAWFGHRRLAILDLSPSADQPMCSDDGMVVLTYNGEIYNYPDLRRELQVRGRRFRSTGDTEVVLRAYEEWGDGFVERLDGMFALAIWDARRSRLILARDRTGKKPLFYAVRGGRLAFGSEIKSVLEAPFVDRRIDESQLAAYLAYGYVPGEATLFEGIREVPPASVVTFDRDGLSNPRTYWDVVARRRPIPRSEWSSRIRETLREATTKRLISDVPLGALLSGGIDSSIVVALMSEATPEPVHTFSIGFPEEPSFDERSAAERVARHFRTSHVSFAVTLSAVGLLDRLIWFHDQPFQDSSAVPTYVVSGLAREHVTVVLNGDGGDEVFGGYDRFKASRIPRLPAPVAELARRTTALLPRDHGYYSVRRRAEHVLRHAEDPVKRRYQSWIEISSSEQRAELLRPDVAAMSSEDPYAVMERCYERTEGLPDLDQILFGNFRTYLPGDLSVKMDRMSMAHSLEARAPFLDTAILELLFGIPARSKVGIRHLKPLLRRAFWPMLPPEIWNRPKHGFGVPMNRWMRGDLGTVFEDELLAPDARCAAVLRQETLERLYREHISEERDHGALLWTVLTLEHWMRAQESPSASPPPEPVLDADARRAPA